MKIALPNNHVQLLLQNKSAPIPLTQHSLNNSSQQILTTPRATDYSKYLIGNNKKTLSKIFLNVIYIYSGNMQVLRIISGNLFFPCGYL